MLPFNYAILKYFLEAAEGDADGVMEKLSSEYSKSRQFKKSTVIEALMTAEANGLLEETRFDLNDEGKLCVFYRATDEGREMIGRYIP